MKIETVCIDLKKKKLCRFLQKNLSLLVIYFLYTSIALRVQFDLERTA